MTLLRISLVEDDEEIRNGLEAILRQEDGLILLGAFPTGEDAIAAFPSQVPPPDLFLMDITLPGASGIETTRELRRVHPDLDVLMLTVRDDDQAVFDSLCAGAVGYLLKTTPPRRLLQAIREARDGGSPMSPSIARRVTASFRVERDHTLTPREQEILAALCNGKSYAEAARDLFISESTVHSHIKNIYRKLEVHSKNEAVAKALRNRWV